ncbi:MAG: aldo/keto reductase [Erysipelotrichaceae bacterium]|nr:aldo/keto reductase [Erysipelotrichaceae bacterium]
MSETIFEKIPKLGFGLMRLPRKEDGTIDVEQTSVMVDKFLDAGMKYFDTAFVYEGSEEAIRKALVERHPRESYYLATKLNARVAANEAEAKKQIETSLERTGAGYFDFYLLHALQEENVGMYDDYHCWDYVKELKAEGKICHYGFSFHSTPERLDQLLTAHPDAEFVQLQINYADWENPSVQSRACYETAVRHGKKVVVMEPVKGGTLASPPQPVKDVFLAADPNASLASWAIRYVASLPGVMVVLSGMSNIAQMEDNLSYMKDFKPLSEEEQEVIAKAKAALASVRQIPCTACHYCTEGCPMQIAIPDIFAAMNAKLIWGQEENAKQRYARATANGGRASDCIHCLQCEGACPQHIEITSWLEEIAAELE